MAKKAARPEPLETPLRRWRKEAGLSQAAFARKAEMDQTLVSKYDRGTITGSLETLAKIQDATGGEVTLEHWSAYLREKKRLAGLDDSASKSA